MELEIRAKVEHELLSSGELEAKIATRFQAEFDKKLG